MHAPSFASYQDPIISNALHLEFPFEIWLDVLTYMELLDVMVLSSTCKALRNFFTQDDTFSLILRQLIIHGSLRWLNPCSLVDGEIEGARLALSTWTAKSSERVFDASDFRFPTFVHTCFVQSAAMKSRRRIWGIVKQLERNWWEQVCT